MKRKSVDTFICLYRRIAKVGVKVITFHAGLLPWSSESKYQWLTYIGKSKQLLYANQNFFSVSDPYNFDLDGSGSGKSGSDLTLKKISSIKNYQNCKKNIIFKN